MSKKKATSSDVAKRAGVSQATVSMVLNKKYNVSFSRETVEKVEQAARELGYHLPGRKNRKESRKEKLIVVFCPTLTSPYYVLLLQGIEAVANKQGYGVFICNTQRDPRLEEKYLRMMGTIEPLGIIYCCNPNPDFQQQVEELAQTIPLVIISNKEKTTTIDAINQDNTVVGMIMGKTFSFVSGALFGAAAGAIIGVALAPRSGAETRAMAADIANDAWDNMRDTYEHSAEEARAAVSDFGPMVDAKTDDLRAKVDLARERMDQLREQLNDAISGGNVTPAADVVVENVTEAGTEATEPSTEA